jgi:hypothetical protein
LVKEGKLSKGGSSFCFLSWKVITRPVFDQFHDSTPPENLKAEKEKIYKLKPLG